MNVWPRPLFKYREAKVPGHETIDLESAVLINGWNLVFARR